MSGVFDGIIPLAGIIFTFGTMAFIFYLLIHFKLKVHKLEHEERMAAIEKGVPVPMSPQRQRNPYFWPAVLIAVGLALFVSGIAESEVSLNRSLIPLLIGIGLLVAHHLHKRKDRKVDPAGGKLQYEDREAAP